MELDLDLVSSFVVLGRERHFGRAASRLHVTSSGLSKRVLHLERQVGAAPIDRGVAGVFELTAEGRRFSEAAAALLAHARSVSEEVLRGADHRNRRPAQHGCPKAKESTRGCHARAVADVLAARSGTGDRTTWCSPPRQASRCVTSAGEATRTGTKSAPSSAKPVSSPHDLSRTFGSLVRLASADLRYIQKALGHDSITVTANIHGTRSTASWTR